MQCSIRRAMPARRIRSSSRLPVDLDDEAIVRLLVDDLGPRLVDGRHRDRLDLWLDVIERAEVDHVLRLANTACVRAGNGIAVEDEAHLPYVDGVHDLADADPAVSCVSLEERNEAVEIVSIRN